MQASLQTSIKYKEGFGNMGNALVSAEFGFKNAVSVCVIIGR